MQYALVNGNRTEAYPNAKGTCTTCGSGMVAKCGPRVMHHWAHFGRRNCDPWWENETPWHREWKNRFPSECREVSHTAADGEIHRADIKTPTGIVIEIQHSTMTDAERLSREAFYRNLIWIVDGKPFKSNFDIFHALPAPWSELAQDLVWTKAQRHMNGSNGGIFFRLSEGRKDYPDITKAKLRSGILHSMRDIQDEVTRNYAGHHQYDWVRPRRTWLDATCPVYIDIGEEFMMRLEIYDESMLQCIRLVSKQAFVDQVMSQNEGRSILTRSR